MTKKEPEVRYEQRYDRFGKGYIEVYKRIYPKSGGKPDEDFFVYTSLMDALEVTRSHLNNQYIKANMAAVVEFIPTGYGRPVRAFPLGMKEQIAELVTNPGGRRFAGAPRTGGSVVVPHVGDAPPAVHRGERYYTFDVLAQMYGVSDTTVRKRLRRAGLDRYFTSLSERGQSGRPRRGLHHAFKKAIEAVFEQGMDAVELEMAGLMPSTMSPDVLELHANRAGLKLVPVDMAESVSQAALFNAVLEGLYALADKFVQIAPGVVVPPEQVYLDTARAVVEKALAQAPQDAPVNTVNPDTPQASAVQDIPPAPVVDPEVVSGLLKELDALGMG